MIKNVFQLETLVCVAELKIFTHKEFFLSHICKFGSDDIHCTLEMTIFFNVLVLVSYITIVEGVFCLGGTAFPMLSSALLLGCSLCLPVSKGISISVLFSSCPVLVMTENGK